MTLNNFSRTLFFLLLSSLATAQSKPGGNSKPVADTKAALNYEYALNDPLNARIYTLSNGLKVYLSVYKNAPRIQTFIAVKAGSKNDPSNATGLAHYLEHMVFKGTDQFGTKDWKKESAEIKKIENLYEVYRNTKDEKQRKVIYHQIDSISGVAAKYCIANEYDKMLAAIGADGTNAFTSFDQTVYVNDIPSNQIENWLKIESERFHKLVLRLFHTELEAVYEEKNRNLDSDENKVYESALEALFKKHTYGTQTTIGTIDHLKNPSMVEINKFFNKYYVPNNMAIVMSGDFDPDKVIVQIEKHFGSYKSKPVDAYKFEQENAINSKVVKEVMGPDPANVNLLWRFGGMGSKDDDMCSLIGQMLFNGTAGLLDLNLNQAQKVLNSNSIYLPMKDYSFLGITGQPKDKQTLEDVEKLLLGQVNLIKKGEFPDWLLQAVITDLKLQRTKNLETNTTRAMEMLDAFTNDVKWQTETERLERISKITKQEVIDFANKNFSENNYVVVYKRIGEDTTVQKVTKPEITPVDLDRENASPFTAGIMKSNPEPIEPRFLDYDKDVHKYSLRSNVPLLYNKNTENKLFEMYYKFDMGKNNDKLLPIAVKYIPFIGTKDMKPAEVKQEFYKLGCSFDVFCDNENTWIKLAGLSDNFEKSVQLFEKVLAEPVVEGEILKNLITNIVTERDNFKLQKEIILNLALVNYGVYGSTNPHTNVLSDEALNKLTTSEISDKIKQFERFEHKILYYGPKESEDLINILNTTHKVIAPLLPVPEALKFEQKESNNTVYVVDYDMKQAEITMIINGKPYDPASVPVITLYNNYFGAGMSSVVFQDLRESKALAYSTYSRYNFPNNLSKKGYDLSYIGSQADKLNEAIKGMKDLLTNIPKSENSFKAAKEAVLQDIRTQRFQKAQILFNYLASEKLGNKTDIRKSIFEKVNQYTFDDVKKFHNENVRNQSMTMLVLGKKENLDLKVLEKYGTVKFLTLKDIFGY